MIIIKNWYILYVRTGYEEKIRNILTKVLDSNCFFPFIPMKIFMFKRKGIVNMEKRKCFPGYVFIKSEYEVNEFIKIVFPIIQQLEKAYLFLYYENKYDIKVRKEERIYLSKLIGSDYCIGNSTGYMEGDRVKVVSGVLMGMESKIKKINRHKREAILNIYMMGENRTLSVAFEILEEI